MWPFGRLFKTRLPLLAPRPQISGEKEESSSYNCFDTHAHTRQTNHYIAHLQVYYQTNRHDCTHCCDKTIIMVPFQLIFLSHFHVVEYLFLNKFSPHFTLFPPAATKDRACGGDVVDYYFVDRMRATMSPYRPKTSAKIRMRIMPTNSLGC